MRPNIRQFTPFHHPDGLKVHGGGISHLKIFVPLRMRNHSFLRSDGNANDSVNHLPIARSQGRDQPQPLLRGTGFSAQILGLIHSAWRPWHWL